MGFPRFERTERKAAVFFIDDSVESHKIYKHAKSMTGYGGPLNGVSVVYVPSEMRAGDAEKIQLEANDFSTKKTLVIAEAPTVKLKRMMRSPKSETLENVVGIRELITINDADMWSAGHDARDELKTDQQVVAAAKKILGSKGMSTTMSEPYDTNSREGDPDHTRSDWTTSVDHHGTERPGGGRRGGGGGGFRGA